MWNDAGGWFVALITASISAGFFTFGDARLVRRARAQAELAAAMPDGKTKSELEALVDRRVKELLARAERPAPTWLGRVALFGWSGLIVSTALMAVLAVASGFIDDVDTFEKLDPWVTVILCAAVACGVVTLVATAVLEVRRPEK